jgi:3-phosphoshikimate 1-carboxyvinyltransferase
VKLQIFPSKVGGKVSAPPSKSFTHRAVILASLAEGKSVVGNPLLSDDTICTIEACRFLGADIKLEGGRLKIAGTGGQIKAAERQWIFAGNSGSTIRMVAPLAALSQTKVVFDGDSRLRQRPVGDLLSALKSLGVGAYSLGSDGYPPIEVQGGNFSGGEVITRGVTSSQHISSLLMIAPYTEEGIKIRIADSLNSRPYIDITIDVMRAFGVEVANRDYKNFLVKGGQRYQARQYQIEGDYSSAAYFFAAGAIGEKPVAVKNLKPNSVQGDRYFLDILSQMGCAVEYQKEQIKTYRNKELAAITLDMGDYPDLVPTVSVVAAYARGKTKITNIAHLRFKESDRISDTAAELVKMGIKVDVSEDTMVVYGGKPRGAELKAHNDHRLAMSFAIAALFAEGGSVIDGAEAVNKSYPKFFTDLKKLGARIKEL